MRNLLIAAAIVMAVGLLFVFGRNASVCGDIKYTDINGKVCHLGKGRPALVGFWIGNCTYSDHALYLLSAAREKYPETQLDVTGFYLNDISSAELTRLSNGLRFTVAAAQPPVDLVASLAKTFKFDAPGRALYVVSGKGRIREVDISDVTADNGSLLKKIDAAVRTAMKD